MKQILENLPVQPSISPEEIEADVWSDWSRLMADVESSDGRRLVAIRMLRYSTNFQNLEQLDDTDLIAGIYFCVTEGPGYALSPVIETELFQLYLECKV